MSTIKVTNIEHASTANGGIQLDNAGHVTVDGVQMPTAGALSNRNLIINGNMIIDQRKSGSAHTPANDQTYTLDRWMLRNAGGSGRFSVQQSGTSPNNIDPSMLLTVTTTDAPAAGEFYGVEQRVEGYVLSPSAIGSSTAKALTLSFWVRSSLTGTYCCSFRNAAADRSFVAEYSISAANTWEFKTIQIAAKTDGTWNTTNNVGAYVDWCLGSGANFEGSTGWQSANRVATSNQVDWINTSGATFHLTGVQLELGEQATPFEHRNYGDELQRCERYLQQWKGDGTPSTQNVIAGCGCINPGYSAVWLVPSPKMRGPFDVEFENIMVSDSATYDSDVTSMGLTNPSGDGAYVTANYGSNGTRGVAQSLRVKGGTSGFLRLDAEL